MRTGALITAAGMSSRMGDFKPMLEIGNISVAKRIIATLQQCGIDKIAVVTGYNAQVLERHLAGNGIVFLRNEEYESTQMFDSVKIGLEYLKDKCDRILFTPVDIPLFTADTVNRLLESDAALACPVCSGERGHPIMLSSSIADSILTDSGESGLKGALSRCGTEMLEITVSDLGVLKDADTPEDFEALVRYHNSQLIRPVADISLAKEKVFFDTRMATLLQLVEETGSVRTACKRMQLSYSSGWNILRTLEEQLSRSLIERTQGGAGGGRSYLTEYGRQFLNAYKEYSQAVKSVSAELFGKYFEGLF